MGEQIDEFKTLETLISSSEQNPERNYCNFDENPSGCVNFEQFNRKKLVQCDKNCSILVKFVGKSSSFDYGKYLDKTLMRSPRGGNDNYALGGETLVDGVSKTLEKSIQVDGDNDNYAVGGETLVDGVAKTLEKPIQVDVDGGKITRKPSKDDQVVDGDTLFAKTVKNGDVGGEAVVVETLEKSRKGDVDGGGDTNVGETVEQSSKYGELGGNIFVGKTLEESSKYGGVGDMAVVKALEKSSEDGEVGKTLEKLYKDGEVGGKTLEKSSRNGEVGKTLEKSSKDGEVCGKTLEKSSRDGEVGGKTLEKSSRDGEVGGGVIVAKTLEKSLEDGEVGDGVVVKISDKSLEDGEVGDGVVVAKTSEKSLQDGEVGDGVVAKTLEKSSDDCSNLFSKTLEKVSNDDDEDVLVDRFSKINKDDSSCGSYFETLAVSDDEDSFHERSNRRYSYRRGHRHCGYCGGINGFCECHSGRMRPMSHLSFFPQDEYSPYSNYHYGHNPYQHKWDRQWRDGYYTHKRPKEPLSYFTWDEPECAVGAGLANMGNTCFLNSIVQCFIHTVPFVQGLQTIKHDSSIHGEDDFCLLCAVCAQIELSLASSGGSLRPLALVDNLNQISSFFRRYQQEDAHEFLQCILDKLDSNWSKYETNTNESSSSDNSLVKQVFGGRLVSQLHCNNCDHNSYTYEPLIDLSLGIEEADDVESALRCFTKVESIGDTEKFTCESCKEQVTGEKQFMLDQLPSVAAFHLKRFKSDGIVVEKIDKTVKYPLELDLAPYTRGATDRNEELKYELYALVVHVGLSSTSGHYYCYVRTGPKSWYQFDDSKVHRVTEYHALNQDAYILFYARKGTQWFRTFIEKSRPHPKNEILNASPKSVLDETDECSTSNCLEIVLHHSETDGDAQLPVTIVNEISVNPSTDITNVQDSASQENVEDETGRLKSETCSSYCLENTGAGIHSCPRRQKAAQIQEVCGNDESAQALCSILLGRLKMEDKTPSSAKKPMDMMAKPNLKRKQIAKYMSRSSSLHIGRRRFFGAVLTGASSDRKRRKQVPYWVRRRSRKKAKFDPKRS